MSGMSAGQTAQTGGPVAPQGAAPAVGQPNQGSETPDQALLRAQTAAQAKRFGEAIGICNDVLAATRNTRRRLPSSASSPV